jgi:hypothetical protein
MIVSERMHPSSHHSRLLLIHRGADTPDAVAQDADSTIYIHSLQMHALA